jgi:pantoate--beta-alanine ligase
MRNELENTPGVTLEYAVIVNHESMRELTAAEPRMVALVAARVGSTRLIDNMILRLPSGTIT